MRKGKGILVLTVLASLFALVGCGGGGGSAEQVSWDGSTDPAVMDTTDPTAWAVAQYEMETPGEKDVVLLGEATAKDPMAIARAMPGDPAKLVSFFRSVVASLPEGPIAAPQGYEVVATDVLVGNISGSVTMTLEYDYANENLRMTLEAADYADDSQVWLEEMDGTYILSGGEDDFKVIFRDFYRNNLDDDGEETLFDGSFAATYDSATTTTTTHITMDLAVTDFVTGESAWFHDYDYTEVEDVVAETFTISGSGRIYKNDEGYVDFDISPSIVYDWGASYPNTGAITFSSGGEWVKLEFLSASTFKVTSSWGFDSGTIFWTM